ncbi:ABC-F family ATP-binding cassette domain-containing protein [Nitrospina gracilis]|uniref:ABC-F family ATP-binding cassette domain-containing protein n=1 Tax=Nitrospina gracilis TaxID=35801 RepID=UPI001F00EF15|nr:ABC-F family ATP-binding cassette domain-containing protein [Nitrospina gracilis]MCF8719731.1 ATP-binding cassette subfamily F protein 3 [Nitrospina gracilis Nb-211]
MIQLQNLKKQYGPKVLFDGVGFHLKPGERVGLVGENGMGKTTLFRVIVGHEDVDAGRVHIRKGARVAMLSQELETVPQTVLERVVEGDARFAEVQKEMERLHNDTAFHDSNPEEWSRRYGDLQHEFERHGGYERESRAQSILSGLGFRADQVHKPLETFSGGWRMRAELARLLLQSPDVLLLDEPTNHLDLQSVVWLESFLKTYEGSLLLISHDRRFLNALAGRIAELDRGKLTVYTGNYDDYERQKAERIAQLEAEAANQQRRVAEIERFVERFRAKNTKATQVQSRIKQLEKMEKVETHRGTKTIHFRFPQPGRTGRIVARLENVDKAYGPVTVYRDFSIQIERGMKIALVGPNGAGKSTLLKLLAAQVEADAGTIELGHNVTRAYYAQHHVEILNPQHTVLQSLDESAPQLTLTAQRNILGAFLFSGDDVDKKVGVLSGGERSRLSLARMLAAPAPFLLLDEPTNHLDIRSCEILAAALADFDGTVVTISHDRYFLDGLINRVWEVDGGQLKEYLGNFSHYEWMKRKEEERAAEAESKSAASEKTTPARRDKEQKRKEAEERNRRYRRLKPLKERAEALEKKLELVMGEKAELEERLADSDIYQERNKDTLMQSLARQKELTAEENTLLTEWDRVHYEIEALSDNAPAS